MPGLAYGEERLLYPMRRDGERGCGRWKRISWDQALDEIDHAGDVGGGVGCVVRPERPEAVDRRPPLLLVMGHDLVRRPSLFAGPLDDVVGRHAGVAVVEDLVFDLPSVDPALGVVEVGEVGE